LVLSAIAGGKTRLIPLADANESSPQYLFEKQNVIQNISSDLATLSDATPASSSTTQIKIGDERRTNDTDLCVSRRATSAVNAGCDGARVYFKRTH